MNNKILMMSVVGLVLGMIVGFVISSGQINWLTLGALGGILGFLLGWMLSTRAAQ